MKNNSTIKEKVLRPQEAVRPSVAPNFDLSSAELDERIVAALLAADDKKAHNLALLDLRGIATFTDYFVIASGTNQRQVQAISDEVEERLKKAGTRAARIEGYQSAEWILLDYGDLVVHVFEDKARTFYDLERLWREGNRVDLSSLIVSDQSGSLRKES